LNSDCRLAVYGTLAPGKPNAHILAPLGGVWRSGSVRGRLVAKGWGADLGFPALVLDPAGGFVAVQLLECEALPLHWPKLDAFEGEGYARMETLVAVEGGAVPAFIYVAAQS
jgi:gamma-glutamylcyclotransferase (GGCT)/AIG2-like uncharacterized protein YtfP